MVPNLEAWLFASFLAALGEVFNLFFILGDHFNNLNIFIHSFIQEEQKNKTARKFSNPPIRYQEKIMYHFFFVLLVDFKFSRHFFISLKVSLFLAFFSQES